MRISLILPLMLVSLCTLADEATKIEQLAPGVTIVYDETGHWGGPSMGVAHQVNPTYQVKKWIDLSDLPPDTLQKAKEVRLRVYFGLQDYSWNTGDKKHNGLDESFEIHVNGHVHSYPTDGPFPSRAGPKDRLVFGWTDFVLPVAELKPGVNEILFVKSAGPKHDDYIYVGIDNGAVHGHSAVSFDGGRTWTKEKLNAIDAQGEYMVRLVLVEQELKAQATWRPGQQPDRLDPAGLIGYAGTEGAQVGPEGVVLAGPKASAYLEFDERALDAQRGATAELEVAGEGSPTVHWLGLEGREFTAKTERTGGRLTSVLPGTFKAPATLRISGSKEGRTVVKSVALSFSRPLPPGKPTLNMCPGISPPKGKPRKRPPTCRITGNEVTLENAYFVLRLQTKPRPALRSFEVCYLGKSVLGDPAASGLFLLEVAGKRYSARDCEVVSVKPLKKPQEGIEALLRVPERRLEVQLTLAVEDSPELSMTCRVTNRGDASADFKLAFPHLAGLQLSPAGQSDYYLFPYFGGIIADVPTYLRTSYGENSAWWQMIDLFSPSLGGGMYVRIDDQTGLYKCPVLRRGKGYDARYGFDRIGYLMDPELLWNESLAPSDGTAVAFEYVRRTRGPGKSFAPPAARVGVHPGDWHVAMERYAKWAHRVWKWRKYPSALEHCYNLVAPGWGQAPLYKDGAYRTDYLQEKYDIAELMSWWEWSDRGPWRVPMDQLEEKLGTPLYKRYKSYWVVDPATNKLRYPLNRGDYDGYQKAWGGLPALRAQIQKIIDFGMLPMFYMEGILACDNTRVGHEFGPKYGVMNPLWKDAYKCPLNPPGYVASYGSWNMCSDTKWWPEYLARTVQRVCRETGIRGVRLDEYGHRGYPCSNPKHQHLFAEPGHNAWLQAVSRSCALVHAAMDEVDDGLVLTTEFPGYDHMACHLEGCIVYEVASHVIPVRPLPCNLFRFYFPECKVFDLDHKRRAHGTEWKFWNASGSFGPPYPDNMHRLLKENTDAFDRGKREALVRTLVERVYANRFSTPEKTITLLYNARGYTVDEPLLAVKPDAGRHWFELLACRDLNTVAHQRGQALRLKLGRDEVACIAELPRLMELKPADGRLTVSAEAGGADLVVALVSLDGERLLSAPVRQGRATLDLTKLPQDAPRPAALKLFQGHNLVDAAALPG